MRSLTNKKNIIAWCFYDWASSAFPIIVTTFVFATYFTSHVAANEITGTFQWANATAFAGILIAILGPMFGAIADYQGRHKYWLFLFTAICIVSSAMLWFVTPDTGHVYFALTWVVIGTIGLEIAVVFYNSFLLRIAPTDYLGRISGWAWGLGYFGGIMSLSIALWVFIQTPPAWLNTTTAEQVRICGPLVAVWYLIFSLPLFLILPETTASGLTMKQSIRHGLRDLLTTLKTLPQQKNLFLYLIAHLIYADGLNTLFAFGGIYAAGTFHMTLTHVLLFGITLDIAAGLGAIALAWVDDFFGSKPTIFLSLICLVLFGIPLLTVRDVSWFWGIALFLSLFLGPVQAASRSLMARLTPPEKSTEMFGLYSFSGKVTAFIGPWVLGLATLTFHSQRAGMGTILLFFAVGALLIHFVREPKKIE